MNAIRSARPERLYVAADGPRSRAGEAERCAEVRRISTAADWPCKIRTLFHDSNLGCGLAVRSAINWFFEHEDEGVILEDDCLPSQEFFRFCDELLPRYRSDRRVMALCGSCFTPSTSDILDSYYFSYYPDMWGWATWKRAWQCYDYDLSRWPKFKKEGRLRSVFRNDRWRVGAWAHYFDRTAAGEIDTWDYQWIFSVIEQGGLACYPTRNLVSNLGWREDATHTIAAGEVHPLGSRYHQAYEFPIRHPDLVARNVSLESEMEALRLFYLRNVPLKETSIRRYLQVALRRAFDCLPDAAQAQLKDLRARWWAQKAH